MLLGSPQERADVSRNVPGALEQALRDTDTYFGVEAPAHETWQFGAEQAKQITQPTLYVLGEHSSALYVECFEQSQRENTARLAPRSRRARASRELAARRPARGRRCGVARPELIPVAAGRWTRQ